MDQSNQSLRAGQVGGGYVVTCRDVRQVVTQSETIEDTICETSA